MRTNTERADEVKGTTERADEGKAIELFVADIDGCLTYPFQAPDWALLTAIRELNRQSLHDPHIPPITLCTGRPLPYAESVAQWLDIRHPFVFESAGLYDPRANRMWTGVPGIARRERIQAGVEHSENEELVIPMERLIGSPLLEPIARMKNWLTQDLIPRYPGALLEFTKLMDAGIVSMDAEGIRRMLPEIKERVREDSGLEVHDTEVSVNILISGNNKEMGLRLISRETGIPLDRIAYIGDSNGDLPAFGVAGSSHAPANAAQVVKAIPHIMQMEGEVTLAVLQTYEWIVERNRSR